MALLPGVERWVIIATVASVAVALTSLGMPLVVRGDLVQLPGVRLEVIGECTSLAATGLIAAAMMAYPVRPRWKVVGVAVSAGVLWLFNLLRLMALMGVLAWRPSAFEFLHVYLWQAVTLVVVCGLFALWLRALPGPERA